MLCRDLHQFSPAARPLEAPSKIPAKIELVKDMKIMVTDDLETDFDVANDARGKVIDLHPEEPPCGSGPIVHLKYPPAYIVVKLARTRAGQLEGLEPAVIL